MPYARRYKKRKRKATKYQKRKKVYKTSVSKLSDKRINTLVEKRMAEISRREVEKSIAPNILMRRLCWGPYNRATNQFGAGTPLDMDGLYVHMCQIPLLDNATALTVAPQADPALVPTVPNYARGVNVVAPVEETDGLGFRSGSKVTIKNLSAQIRFYLPPSPEGAANRMPRQTIHYQIIAVSDQNAFQLQWKPATINELIPHKGLGYSSRIDSAITADSNDGQPRKVLARGSLTMKQATSEQGWYEEEFRTLFKKCSIPYEFSALNGGSGTIDQNGQQVVSKWKIFLCLRSNVPAAASDDYKCRVTAFSKVSFRNDQ